MSLDSGYRPGGHIGGYPFGQLFGRSDVNLAASTSVIEGLPDEQRTSPVRRTFLLVMLFDLLLTFTLWIIYVQQAVSTGSIVDALHSEVVLYTFRTSLFDALILAAARFLTIEIAYGAFLSRTPWWSAATTGVTCTVLVIKCFIFNFHQHDNNATGLVYAVIISALILTWIETSFLIYRVIPQEKAAEHVTTCLAIDEPDETQSLLGSLRGGPLGRVYSTYTASIGGYYTPAGSHYGPLNSYDYQLATKLDREAAVDIAALLHRAEMLRSELWYLFRLEAWSGNSVNDQRRSDQPPEQTEEDTVQSITLPEYDHRVFRVEAVLEAPVGAVFHDLVYNIDQLSSWNKSVDYVEPLQSLHSENIDVVHNVTHESLGGFISRRDFVLLRHWGLEENRHYLATTSVEHPKCPPMKTCVRAQQLISASVLEPLPGQLNRCKIVWIFCFDLKLSLPQRFVDKALTGELASLLSALKTRARSIRPPMSRPPDDTSFPSSRPTTTHRPPRRPVFTRSSESVLSTRDAAVDENTVPSTDYETLGSETLTTNG